jgi:hypothetical protein
MSVVLVRPQIFINITLNILLGQRAGKYLLAWRIHPWQDSAGMSPQASSIALEKGHTFMGFAIIHLPPPCWKQLLTGVEKWGIWWEIENCKPGMVMEREQPDGNTRCPKVEHTFVTQDPLALSALAEKDCHVRCSGNEGDGQCCMVQGWDGCGEHFPRSG